MNIKFLDFFASSTSTLFYRYPYLHSQNLIVLYHVFCLYNFIIFLSTSDFDFRLFNIFLGGYQQSTLYKISNFKIFLYRESCIRKQVTYLSTSRTGSTGTIESATCKDNISPPSPGGVKGVRPRPG